MKKFMKVCGILALVLIVAGAVMGMAAGAVRGSTSASLEEILYAVTNGRVNLSDKELLEKTWKQGESILENAGEQIEEQGFFDVSEHDMFDSNQEIFEGDVERYAFGSDFRNLDAEIGGSAFYVRESPDGQFYLEAANVSKMQGYVRENTLHIKALRAGDQWQGFSEPEIILYVPAGFVFEKADLEVGAGSIDMEFLYGKEVNLEAGAGSIEAGYLEADRLEAGVGMGAVTLQNMKVRNLTGEVGVGAMYLSGAVDESAELECSMGGLEMELAGTEQDFNYRLECGVGSIELGGESYSGLANEKHINNQASKNMKLECAMGGITVTFAD